MKPIVQILCGMIASGKSSYAKKKAQEGFIIINDDEIVNLVHADQHNLYNKELKILYKSIENHILATSLALNKNVIIDKGTNISIESRKRFLGISKSLGAYCEAVVFQNEKPEVHAERRFIHDNRGISKEKWLEIANYHNQNWELPSLKEGFDIITYVRTSSK